MFLMKLKDDYEEVLINRDEIVSVVIRYKDKYVGYRLHINFKNQSTINLTYMELKDAQNEMDKILG